MKVLIFGGNGYLGHNFLMLYPSAILADADITRWDEVGAVLDKEKPDVVINAAGKTGSPNADWCEDHKGETLASNVTGALVLLEECGKRGIYMVHLGSGCIYEGDNGGQGFSEEDPPNFFGSYYGRTKAWIDQMLSEFPVLILRLRMPFDHTASPKSLINKIRTYKRLLDTQNSLTYMPDFLKAADTLIKRHAIGTYNVVNPGTLSPFDIMTLYKEIIDPSHEFTAIKAEQILEVARVGRSNCVLDASKLAGEGIAMTPVQEAMKASLRALAASERRPVSSETR